MNFQDDFATLIHEKRKSAINSSRFLKEKSDNYYGTILPGEILSVRLKKSEDQKFDNLEFDWNVTSVNNQSIEIQLYLEKAIEVSS